MEITKAKCGDIKLVGAGGEVLDPITSVIGGKDEQIVAVPTPEMVRAIVSCAAVQHILAIVSEQEILICAAIDLVVAIASEKHIDTGTTVERVLTLITPQTIIPGISGERVVLCTAVKFVVAGAALQLVCAGSAE